MKKEWRWLVGFIIPPSCTIRICNPKLKKSTLKTGYATGLKIQRIHELVLQTPAPPDILIQCTKLRGRLTEFVIPS